MHKIKQVLLTGWIAAAAAYVALLPQFYLLYSFESRYALGWSARWRTSILISIALLGLIYFVAYWILSLAAKIGTTYFTKIKWTQGLAAFVAWVFLALFFRTVMAIAFLTEQVPDSILRLIDSPWNKALWYVVVPLGFMGLCRSVFDRLIRLIYGMCAILLLLFMIQSFLWPLYVDDSPNRTFPALANSETPKPGSLYIFLFDEWSYPDSFGSPEFSLDNMPNLKKLLAEATLFTETYSPAVASAVSIPRFLYQPDDRIRQMSYRDVSRNLRENKLSTLALTSIFDLAPQSFKVVVGTYLHYPLILGHKVDRILRFDDSSSHYLLSARVRDYLWTQLNFRQCPKVCDG